jgi:ankyrin repeat protein
MAVGADFVDTFRLLLDHGADPKAKDGAGRTLEEVAKDAPKILKLLRERNRR